MLIVWAVVEPFQFTHPGKGATDKEGGVTALINVSIHAPWEGCDVLIITQMGNRHVSIHAPWEGCDWVGRGSPSPYP